MSHSFTAVLAGREDIVAGAPLSVSEVVETVGEFGTASIGLLAWEYFLDPADVSPAFNEAASAGMLEPVRIDAETGEQMFSVTASGRMFVRTMAA
jgi:hypothetical protein